jgi:uncharacterized protein (TIGR00304 family)
MRKGLSRFAIPLALFVLGIVLLAFSVIEGEGQVHWVLFIPVFTATSIFAFIGTVLIIISIFLFIIVFLKDFTQPYDDEYPRGREGIGQRSPKASTPTSGPMGQKPRKGFGGVVLVGPIPVIFGSDTRTTKIVIILAIILMVVAILFMVFYFLLWNS